MATRTSSQDGPRCLEPVYLTKTEDPVSLQFFLIAIIESIKYKDDMYA